MHKAAIRAIARQYPELGHGMDEYFSRDLLEMGYVKTKESCFLTVLCGLTDFRSFLVWETEYIVLIRKYPSPMIKRIRYSEIMALELSSSHLFVQYRTPAGNETLALTVFLRDGQVFEKLAKIFWGIMDFAEYHDTSVRIGIEDEDYAMAKLFNPYHEETFNGSEIR